MHVETEDFLWLLLLLLLPKAIEEALRDGDYLLSGTEAQNGVEAVEHVRTSANWCQHRIEVLRTRLGVERECVKRQRHIANHESDFADVSRARTKAEQLHVENPVRRREQRVDAVGRAKKSQIPLHEVR